MVELRRLCSLEHCGARVNLVFQRPHKAQFEDMTKYHSDDYVKFLKTIRPENQAGHNKHMTRCTYSV